MLTLGIDDAGRGPLIGPMILAGVLASSEQEKILKRKNIRDSKIVSHPERIKLAQYIKENSFTTKTIKVSPQEIDDSINSGTNLNTVEAIAAAKIINAANILKYRKETIKVILDCPSINTTAWLNTLIKFINHKENLQFICEHKADANYVSVSAASILAKVTREEEVEKIKKKFGEIGSGYPSDPATKEFLKKHGAEFRDAGIFRKTWQTWKTIFPENEKGQTTLEDF